MYSKCNLQVNKIEKVQWTCIVPDVYEWFFDMPVKTCLYHAHQGPFPLTALFWLLRQEKESQSRADLTAKFVDLMIHKHKKNNHFPPNKTNKIQEHHHLEWNSDFGRWQLTLHWKMLCIFYNKKYLTQLAHTA